MKISNPDITEIVTLLHSMKPAGFSKKKFEKNAEKVANSILVIAGVSLFILIGLAAYEKLGTGLSEIAMNIALSFGIVTMILPLVSLLIGIGLDFWTLIAFHKNSLSRFLAEIANDELYVEKLQSFLRKDLEEAKRCIQIKTNRIRKRIGFFIGDSNKIALFYLAGMGWMAFKELSSNKAASSLSFTLSNPSLYDAIFYITAALTGIALGAVMLNLQLQHYIYRLELLDIVISRKPAS